MNIFKRLLRIGQAEIHAAVEKMEDPIKMTEQGLRELRADVAEATEAYASVKAMAIRTENEQVAVTKDSESYGEKAMLIMQKAQRSEVGIEKAEELAKEALALRRQYASDSEALAQQALAHQQSAAEVLKNIEILKENLAKWEKELKTLKARVTVSKATERVNKQLAHIDTNSTIAMLERMKGKVADKEALSQAYGEIVHAKHERKDELNNILNDDTLSVEQDLEAIKKELGINTKS